MNISVRPVVSLRKFTPILRELYYPRPRGYKGLEVLDLSFTANNLHLNLTPFSGHQDDKKYMTLTF